MQHFFNESAARRDTQSTKYAYPSCKLEKRRAQHATAVFVHEQIAFGRAAGKESLEALEFMIYGLAD